MSLNSFLSAILATSWLTVSFAQYSSGTGAIVVDDPANQNFLNFTVINSHLNTKADHPYSGWSVEQTGLGEFTLTDEHQDTVEIQIQNANEYTQQELVDLLNSESSYTDREDNLGSDVADAIADTVLFTKGTDFTTNVTSDNKNREEVITTTTHDNAGHLVAMVETHFILTPPTPN